MHVPSSICRLAAVAASGLLALTPARARAEGVPLSPSAGWATAYLVSTALAAEYQSVVGALPGPPAARRAKLQGELGRGLWLRGHFALAALQAKGQELPDAGALPRLLAEHDLLLTGASAAAATVALGPAVARAAETEPLNARDQAVGEGFAAVARSFPDAGMRGRFTRLTGAFALPAPACPLDYTAVRSFAAHQRRLLADARGASAKELLAPLATWSDEQVRCLVFTLMAATPEDKAKAGFEPLFLMRALAETNAPLARDLSVRALVAVRQLQLGRYPETLAALLDLSDLDESFRLPYELVQRVYSIRQKGDGSVALQGI